MPAVLSAVGRVYTGLVAAVVVVGVAGAVAAVLAERDRAHLAERAKARCEFPFGALRGHSG